jgi:hypothetical protein
MSRLSSFDSVPKAEINKIIETFSHRVPTRAFAVLLSWEQMTCGQHLVVGTPVRRQSF